MKNNKKEENLEFIRKNYPINGSRFCAEYTGYSEQKVRSVASYNNIKSSRIYDYTTFDPTPFLNIRTPEVAYVLGLIWADGWTRNGSEISIEILGEDMDTVKDVFLQTGEWRFSERTRIGRTKPIALARVNNKVLYDFLAEHDYEIKSGASACKILSKIPDELKHYFFRGISDGDGCFYYLNDSELFPKTKLRHYVIGSCLNQDWKYIKDLFDSLSVYSAIKRITKINKSNGKINSNSIIRVSRKEYVIAIGNYLYKNYEIDKIGFPRKYKKFQDILNNIDAADVRRELANQKISDTR